MQQVPPPPPPLPAGSMSPVVAPALPAGWTEHWGPDNLPYYYNAATRVSTYVRPTAAGSPPPPPPPGFESQAGATTASAVTNGEDEQQQQQEEEQGQDQAESSTTTSKKEKKKKKEKPIEKVPIEGTAWVKITTNEGNVFYTNRDTKSSVWTVPEEVTAKLQELERKKAAQLAAAQAAEAEKQAAAARLLQEKEAEMQRLREELEREREASRKRKLEEEEEQERRAQMEAEESARKKHKSAAVADDDDEEGLHNGAGHEDGQDETYEQQVEQEPEPELEDWERDELKAKEELEKELQPPTPASEQTDFSTDEAIALFKIMLSEKDINPMRPWDMELPKFINDPRYKAVKTLAERRDLFDEHCKQKIRERRAQKAAGNQPKVDPATAYRTLLTTEVTSTRTHWEDFRQKFKKDSRFTHFGRDDREREKAFKNWLRELGEIKRADAQKAEEKFVAMLKERDIPDDTRWSDIKGKLSSDPRYQAIASSSQREDVFKKYLATRPKPATEAQIRDSQKEEEERKKAAAEERKAKQAASLKEREEKVRREKAALDRVAGRTKAEAGREESVREYKNLLIDAVRDHNARWDEQLDHLEKDRRFKDNNLSISEKRRLFDQHLDEIYDKRIGALEGLFAQHAPKLTTTFDDVYASISANPIVTRLDMSESRIKRLFDDWSKKRFDQSRREFDEMLSESTFVDYWGRLKQESGDKEEDRTKGVLGNDNEGDEEMNVGDGVDLRAMAAQIDMKEIHAVLRHDKRYTIFDSDPTVREDWIKEYIERLDKPKQTVHQQSAR